MTHMVEAILKLGQTVPVAATLVLTLLALYPIVIYLWTGWSIKKEDITNTFSVEAMELYLKGFQRESVKDKEAEEAFDDLYDENFGRYRYAFPILLFVPICLAGVFLACEWAAAHIHVIRPEGVVVLTAVGGSYFGIPTIAAIAEVGAYVWIVSDLFDRSQRQNLRPADVLNAGLRLSISGMIGYAFSAIGGGGPLSPAIAFSAGAFPLSTVRVMLRRFATKQLGLGVGIEKDDDQVIELNSIDHPTADLLQDAGISTVAQLAYCDPVQLCMRTGLKFDYVVDIVSQALAWLYFGDKLENLRLAGLRGAIEIGNLLEDAKGDSREAAAKRALVLCDTAATMVDLSPPAFLNACDEIAGDAHSIFLIAVWKASGLDGEEVKEDGEAKDEDEREPRT